MHLSYAQAVALVRMDPYWRGFEDCVFEPRVLPLEVALDRLFTCWGHEENCAGSLTFDAHRALAGIADKARRMAEDFWLHVPVMGIAMSRNLLHARWGACYPNPGPELVVADANHRLAAMAYRRVTGKPNPAAVTLFVCE